MKFVFKQRILAQLIYLLPLSILLGCQSLPGTDELTSDSDSINWLDEANQAKSPDSFILALVSLMDMNLNEELAGLYQFYDSKGELISSQRMINARMNEVCPAPSQDWIYLANYKTTDGFRVNFRVEHDSDIYWCGLAVSEKNGEFSISDIIDYGSNLSVVSALESFEALPPLAVKSKTRSKTTWGVKEFLTSDFSVSGLDELISQYDLDPSNALLAGVRARLLDRPISDESMAAYNQVFLVSKNLDDWPLQRFYQQLGQGASESQLIEYADNFTRLTSDPVWPYIFWSRVANAQDEFDLSERLLHIALFYDPLNELPYFALMQTYAHQVEYGHLLQVRSLLESKFDYEIDPEYFFAREGYDDFVLSEDFKSWEKQR